VFVFQCVARRNRYNQKRLCLKRDVSHECKTASVIAAITYRTNQHTWFCNAVQGFSEPSPVLTIIRHILSLVRVILFQTSSSSGWSRARAPARMKRDENYRQLVTTNSLLARGQEVGI